MAGQDLHAWEGSEREGPHGQTLSSGTSRLKHNLGIPVVASCVEETGSLACGKNHWDRQKHWRNLDSIPGNACMLACQQSWRRKPCTYSCLFDALPHLNWENTPASFTPHCSMANRALGKDSILLHRDRPGGPGVCDLGGVAAIVSTHMRQQAGLLQPLSRHAQVSATRTHRG